MNKYIVERYYVRVGDQRLGNCRVCKKLLQRYGYYYKIRIPKGISFIYTATCSKPCADYYIMQTAFDEI